ncbi:hypothetical protein ACU8NH_24155 [Rhizobium leguminosarum]
MTRSLVLSLLRLISPA